MIAETTKKNAGRDRIRAATAAMFRRKEMLAAARKENNARQQRNKYRLAHGIPLTLEKLKPWEYAKQPLKEATL